MAHEEQRYTAGQIITTARDLQDAAGAPEKPIEVSAEKTYTLEQAINLLSEEIRILRERGFTNERIADLFTSFEIAATAAEIEDFYERDETIE
ncbi:hypothetical protein [Granulicella arctica]|uniref:Uncharacterized protein n=1 Tax=Granulicella arctica TaxID=940613 RepID=A0A7Y9TH43_9BACT|nr:hypothetical protein [Granulicella arctica]NYF80169.1 hypothetical protein [Granulicella arctica]